MFLCQPFADYCCAFHVFPTVGSISHTRSRYQGTDERLPAVGRARAGAGGACVASCSSSLVSFLSSLICYLYISGPSEDRAGLTSVLRASPCLINSRAAESVCVCVLNCCVSPSLLCCVHDQEKQPGFQTPRGRIPPHSPPPPLCRDGCAAATLVGGEC